MCWTICKNCFYFLESDVGYYGDGGFVVPKRLEGRCENEKLRPTDFVTGYRNPKLTNTGTCSGFKQKLAEKAKKS